MSARAREHAGNADLPGLRRQSVSRPGRTCRTAAARSGECGVRPEDNELQVRKVASAQASPQAYRAACVAARPNRAARTEENLSSG
eukprot:2455289-Prymnesium_polylepis.1